MKYHEAKYVQATIAQAATIIDFISIDEFSRYLEIFQSKLFFKLKDAHNNLTHFAVLQENALLRLAANGYQNLHDITKAEKNHFPSAAIFYEAEKEGYAKYEEFKMVKEAGIASHDVFQDLKNKGFITGFTEYNNQLAAQNNFPEMPEFQNPYQLYQFSEQNNFENFSSLITALQAGFANADVKKAAVERDFIFFNDYDEAIKNGFITFGELDDARKLGAKNRPDYLKLLDIRKVGADDITDDKKLLLILLSKIEQGKKVSINKLIELHNKLKEEYYCPENPNLPNWFTVSLNGSISVIEFLQSEHTVKYGLYDMDGEFFQLNRIQDRKVILDGSNVAHNSHGIKGTKPRAENMIKMVAFLKEKGFNDISIFADASLYHRLEDRENLGKLKEIATYQEAPAETSADVFIIQYVKSKHCMLVSNDTFREWKIQDPWVAENIDYYRLSFMIKDDEVLMPDLK